MTLLNLGKNSPATTLMMPMVAGGKEILASAAAASWSAVSIFNSKSMVEPEATVAVAGSR